MTESEAESVKNMILNKAKPMAINTHENITGKLSYLLLALLHDYNFTYIEDWKLEAFSPCSTAEMECVAMLENLGYVEKQNSYYAFTKAGKEILDRGMP